MPIYKRKNSNVWWVDITTPSGKRIRISSQTTNRREAQEYHDRLKVEYWKIERLGEQPDVYFEQAALTMLKSIEHQKTYPKQLAQVEYWLSRFAGRTICSLTANEVLENLPEVILDQRLKSRPMKGSTKNRYLAVMSKIFTVSYKKGWLRAVPDLDRHSEAKVHIRWIRKNEAQSLLSNLKHPWMKDVCTLALATGMRLREILFLEWSEIDLDKSIAWVLANKSKSGFPRAVPLNDDALRVLRTLPHQHKRWAIINPKTNAPYNDINREDFNQALINAGIQQFRFHDLRHTWASWHAQNGTPLMILKELGGWRTIEMVQKYAHLSATHLSPHVNSVVFLPQANLLNSEQIEHRYG